MPLVTGPEPLPAQVSGVGGPELQDPVSHRLIGDLQAALGQEFFDISEAEREAQIEILPRRERLGDHPGRQS